MAVVAPITAEHSVFSVIIPFSCTEKSKLEDIRIVHCARNALQAICVEAVCSAQLLKGIAICIWRQKVAAYCHDMTPHVSWLYTTILQNACSLSDSPLNLFACHNVCLFVYLFLGYPWPHQTQHTFPKITHECCANCVRWRFTLAFIRIIKISNPFDNNLSGLAKLAMKWNIFPFNWTYLMTFSILRENQIIIEYLEFCVGATN